MYCCGCSFLLLLQEWDKIWTINKKIIDPVCPRHTAVEAQGKVLLTLAGGPTSPESSSVPRHKKHPPAGTKQLVKLGRVWLDQADAAAVAEGEEVTLMDWGNAIIKVRVCWGGGVGVRAEESVPLLTCIGRFCLLVTSE
jgi:glutamyl-tRNA synthetase